MHVPLPKHWMTIECFGSQPGTGQNRSTLNTAHVMSPSGDEISLLTHATFKPGPRLGPLKSEMDFRGSPLWPVLG